ncbi:MAG: RNA polymerase factor sigma-54 [Caulobacteraceae bacterium]
MALSHRLEMRQGQGLVITPQLQQAIKLLQLSNLELEEFVDGELERNPLLTRDEREGDREAPRAAEEITPQLPDSATDRMSGAAAQDDLDAPADDAFERDAPGNLSDGQAGGSTDWSRAGRGGSFGVEGGETSEVGERPLTLVEHLTDQMRVAHLSGARRAIATVLIDSVDEGGYLRADLTEIGQRLGARPGLVEEVLGVLQGFEPTGVFARDVAECLKLQLVERGRFDPAMDALLANLDLLARRDMAGLRRACGVDAEDLSEMIVELRGLTPRPGAAFGSEPAQTVIPDAFVKEMANGAWRVELNSDTLPRLLVDRRYHARVSAKARGQTDANFVSECLASANWLVKSLDQRARTILKVAGEIVRQQDAFLAFGVEHLRPLNLKTVAEAIGMHESTVSRVTSNKYLATPRGVFEMKFFFTSAIGATGGGEAHSAEAVRHKIRQLIAAERAGVDVHSDDAIVEILKEAGVDIARRTVAKYRDAMRIPSSVLRKRILRAG